MTLNFSFRIHHKTHTTPLKSMLSFKYETAFCPKFVIGNLICLCIFIFKTYSLPRPRPSENLPGKCTSYGRRKSRRILPQSLRIRIPLRFRRFNS